MSSMIGERVRLSLFGQSHGEAVGVVMDGLPSGIAVDEAALGAFLRRRAPGRDAHSSARTEPDTPRIVSGLFEGRTCGAPLCVLIENRDARPGDYAALADVIRPGTADFPARVRWGDAADLRGGGHQSGRLTAPLCAAGGIALQALATRGIAVGAHIESIAECTDTRYDPVDVTAVQLRLAGGKPFPTLDEAAGQAMRAAIAQAKAAGDSLGGVIECGAIGLPAGLGSPMFGGVENRLSAMLFGIPGIRGVSFGAGFDAARMTGSAHNDAYAVREGRVVTLTNHHGGVLGGMTTGMPLLVSVAVKPTPSISRPQQAVRISTMREEALSVGGRHDPCIVPRAVPCVEAAVAIVLLDLLLQGEARA